MIAIVDYRAGNLTSVQLAFDTLGVEAAVTSDVNAIRQAERVVFPGVGAAGTAMTSLRELRLVECLLDVAGAGIPFLGICLGTQVILERSAEDGGIDCLGLIPGSVKAFKSSPPLVKVPQMGWNDITIARPHPVLSELVDGNEFYFVHSYYPAPLHNDDIIATTSYADVTFASVIGCGNLVATQFHPEKSGRIGLRLLHNFATWTGTC